MRGPDPQVDLLSRLLDAADLRHRVIANNVANVNTPGYHRQEVRFEEALADALGRGGDAAAVTRVRPEVVEAVGDVARADGNTVDIDAEMGRLAKNSLLYRLFAQVLTSQLGTMRSAITGK